MQSQFTWRHQYDLKADKAAREATDIMCPEDSLTQQQFKDEMDINVLAERFGISSGPMPVAPFNPAHYGDFTEVPDLKTALDLVRDANDRFMALPPKLRSRFHNSPAELWDFINDPDNADEAVRLELLRRAPEPSETPPPAVPGA
ncbi:MAG: internal scaffolding protein [Microvirus sp.]|nr:MAG: internal scaffolding protein [Microvirus sp.]